MEEQGAEGKEARPASIPVFDLQQPAQFRFLFQAVWESAVDAMALSDPDGIVLAVNPAYCGLYGYSAGELIGHSFAVIFPEEVRTQAEEEYRRYFADTIDPEGVQATVRSKDDQERLVDVRYSFIEQDGRRIAMLSVIRDVTERARLEQSERDLLNEKDNFLLAMSHDLKTPITAIRGRAQLLQRNLARGKEAGPAKLMEGLEQIETIATRMGDMIDGLLDVSTIRGRGQALLLHRSPVDLAALVRAGVDNQKESSDRHRIEIDAQEPLMGRWDETRLARVVDNLITNALKYSPGGGKVVISLREETGVQGSEAVMRVTDSGIGIPKEDRERIFEPFGRGSNVTQAIPGSGIGLAGVRQIVEKHGGSVSVDSVEGEGSTFTVRLPRTAPAE